MIERGVYVNEKVPAGDGGVTYGQIAWLLWREKLKPSLTSLK